MRSLRSLFGVALVALALTLAVPTASASTPHTLKITKECSEYTGTVPSFCTITASNVAAIPVGTKVLYYGPIIASSIIMSSTAILDDGHGNKATGYCQVDNVSGVGMCAFWKGVGKLAGFHALVNVTCGPVICDWTGRYYYTGK